MPRRSRLRLPGFPFHVIQRGHNKAACFRCEADRKVYLAGLHGQACEHGLQVHAYCLMTNHVHLLLTPITLDGMSLAMAQVGQRYSRYFNGRYDRCGTLWDGRYRSNLVDTDNYLLICHRYIEMNPVRAGMVSAPVDHLWSSYHANAHGRRDPLVTPHPMLMGLGESAAERRRVYREFFLTAESPETLKSIRSSVNGGYVLGDKLFIERLARTVKQPVMPPKRGRPPKMEAVPI